MKLVVISKKNLFIFISILFNCFFLIQTRVLYGQNLEKINSSIEQNQKSQSGNEYLIGTGDELLIKFDGIDLYTNVYVVDQNGYLFLPELNNFYVRDKTINEITSLLNEEYKNYIKLPLISVEIFDFRPITVFITGEVKNPGIYSFSNKGSTKKFENNKYLNKEINNPYNNLFRTSIFEIIRKSGGVTNYANLSKVKVVRRDPSTNGINKIQTNVDLLSLILEGDQSQNIRIFDGDSIIIPKSKLYMKDQILALNKTNLAEQEFNIYVTGAVENPGGLIINRGTSLNQAIAIKGRKLQSGKVEFIRFEDNGSTYKKIFNYDPKAVINSKANPILKSGDIINIRRNVFGNATVIIREIATPILTSVGLINLFD